MGKGEGTTARWWGSMADGLSILEFTRKIPRKLPFSLLELSVSSGRVSDDFKPRNGKISVEGEFDSLCWAYIKSK